MGCIGGKTRGNAKGRILSKEIPKGGILGREPRLAWGTKGREYFKRGIIRGKAKVSTGEGTNGENAKGTFSRGIPKGVMATENT